MLRALIAVTVISLVATPQAIAQWHVQQMQPVNDFQVAPPELTPEPGLPPALDNRQRSNPACRFETLKVPVYETSERVEMRTVYDRVTTYESQYRGNGWYATVPVTSYRPRIETRRRPVRTVRHVVRRVPVQQPEPTVIRRPGWFGGGSDLSSEATALLQNASDEIDYLEAKIEEINEEIKGLRDYVRRQHPP